MTFSDAKIGSFYVETQQQIIKIVSEGRTKKDRVSLTIERGEFIGENWVAFDTIPIRKSEWERGEYEPFGGFDDIDNLDASALKCVVKSLRLEKEGLVIRLNQSNEKIGKLEEDINCLEKENRALETDLKNAQNRIDKLQREKDELKEQLRQAQKIIDKLQREKDELKEQLRQAQKKIFELKKIIEGLEERLKRIVFFRRFFIVLCIAFGMATIAFGILYANSHTRYVKRLANKEEKLVLLVQRKDSLITEINSLSIANDEIQKLKDAEIQKLKDTIEAKQKIIDGLKISVEEPFDIQELLNKIKRLESEKTDLIGQKNQQQETIKQLEDTNSRQKRSINQQNKIIKEQDALLKAAGIIN